jgi:hypothetical protein
MCTATSSRGTYTQKIPARAPYDIAFGQRQRCRRKVPNVWEKDFTHLVALEPLSQALERPQYAIRDTAGPPKRCFLSLRLTMRYMLLFVSELLRIRIGSPPARSWRFKDSETSRTGTITCT